MYIIAASLMAVEFPRLTMEKALQKTLSSEEGQK